MDWSVSPRRGGVRSARSRQNKKLKGLKREKDSEYENCKAVGMNVYMGFFPHGEHSQFRVIWYLAVDIVGRRWEPSRALLECLGTLSAFHLGPGKRQAHGGT